MAIVEGAVDIREEKVGEQLVLHFAGKLDALSSPSAEKKIFDCISAGQKILIFDFSHLRYLSSAGLRILLSATKKMKTHSGKIIIIGVQQHVMNVLKMTGFDHLLELTETLDEALNLV